jgi:phenylpropionate dioxygenase-like ring-hydroxylating dioxygenase large terminal subunit
LPHFNKPDAGSWTEHYPELGTAPVDYTDSIDPAFFEAEREAIFKRTWLNVGRVERLPRTGSYFTKELPSAGPGISVIIVKTKDGSIKAYHNVCRHRGNKLVWNDFPHEETSGTCRQFTCKYHAWRYNLDGDLTFIQQEDEFFDVDKGQYGLVGVRCEIWEGFIFVNLDQDAKPLSDYLGPLAKGIQGYPFHEMTETYSYRAEVGSNWKLFIDAFAEFYHAPVLHQGQYTKDEAAKIIKYGFDGPGTPQRVVRSMGQAGCHREPRGAAARRQPDANSAVGHRLVAFLPELHAADLGARLVPDLPLLADRRRQAHLRVHAVFRSTAKRAGTPGARTGGGDIQGVRAAGRQHPGSDSDHDRHQGCQRLSAVRSRNPAPASAQSDR